MQKKVTNLSTLNIGFSKFLITCDNGKSLDFVELYGCTYLWFDPYDSAAKDTVCYEETVSEAKTGKFGKGFKKG